MKMIIDSLRNFLIYFLILRDFLQTYVQTF